MTIIDKVRSTLRCHRLFFLAVMVLISSPAAAVLSISDTPLFLTVPVMPNLVMTLDDSLSMGRSNVPDPPLSLTSAQWSVIVNSRLYKSHYYNALYYDPNTTYTIPTRSDGTVYNTSFAAAYLNGFDTSKGNSNLGSAYKVTYQTLTTDTTGTSCPYVTSSNVGGWGCLRAENPGLDFAGLTQSGVAAYYYLWYSQTVPSTAQPAGCVTTTADGGKGDEDCYIKITVGSSTTPKDIAAGTAAQQQQNFAIWYSFYRTRALSVMSAAMNEVNGITNSTVRFGWQTLIQCATFGTTCTGYDSVNHTNRIRTLTSAVKTDFSNWLQRFKLSGATPMRSALKRAGDYFTLSGINSPYAEEPYVTLGTELSCRRNYHLLFTDGLWNSDSGFSIGGNVDSTAQTLPDGKSYTPQYPYKNTSTAPPSTYSYSNSLADIAFYYWMTDLRKTAGTALTNNITPRIVDLSGDATSQYWNPKNDPATWQHMVNFTIGLGLSSTMTDPAWGGGTYAGDYPALAAGTKFWPPIQESPTLGSEPPGHVYDLWHAAIDSRGQFFSVEDPTSLSNAFKSILSSIVNSESSATALAANSTSIQVTLGSTTTNTVLYQARFQSADWSGRFDAFPVNSSGGVNTAYWSADKLIPEHTARNIITYNGGSKETFTNCTGSLLTALGGVVSTCNDKLAWLRGNTSKEQRFAGGIFRNRTVRNTVTATVNDVVLNNGHTNVLGDIINSDPAYAKNGDYGYGGSLVTMPEKSTYNAFVAGNSSRVPAVYVGANDGMLHAFRADLADTNSGKELFAYVPAGVYSRLNALTDPAYIHKYSVDGPPSVGDAYLGSWKTVLVSGLGGGGKSIYALDISAPDSFGPSNVLWEYSGSAVDTGGTGTTDVDGMGLTYSQPQIARLKDGSWAAIFGNGYNSTSDKAFLYIVNLSTGVLIKKIATDSTVSNGLSTPYLYDADGDKIIDAVYAGDLQGRMWKFDLSAASSASWGVGNGGVPLFTATNGSGQVQPITAPPTVGGHPNGGVLVYFGTGSYLTSADVMNTQVQSFYAIWDKPATTGTVARASLQSQTITQQIAAGSTKTNPDGTTTTFAYDLRETSQNTVDWSGGKRGWYLDLLPPSGVAAGERVDSVPLLKYDRVIFVTKIPSTDACVPGGDSWLMELGLVSGGRTTVSSFDFNNDDKFDDKDLLADGSAVSGVKSTVGITKSPVWLDKTGSDIAFKEMAGTSGGIMSLKNKGAAVTAGNIKRLYWMQIQ